MSELKIPVFPTVEATPETEQKPPYTPEEISRLLVHSFRFSQGDTILQEKLLELVAFNNQGRLTPDAIEKSVEPAAAIVKKIIFEPSVHSKLTGDVTTDEFIKSQVDVNAETLIHSIFKGERLNPDIGFVARGVISRDYKYMVLRDGGRYRQTPVKMAPGNDPYLSHFVYHGLLGKPTGMAEYDQVFRQIKDNYLNHYETWHSRAQYDSQEVIDAYMQHHPDQAQLLPDYQTVAA